MIEVTNKQFFFTSFLDVLLFVVVSVPTLFWVIRWIVAIRHAINWLVANYYYYFKRVNNDMIQINEEK